MGIKSSKSDETADEEHEKFRVLLMGLDGAGKTSFLYKHKLNKMIEPIPSIEEQRETIRVTNDVFFEVSDLSGGGEAWKKSFNSTVDGFFYVVDASDRQRLPEAGKLLFKILTLYSSLHAVSVVVIANKQDVKGCATVNEVTDVMGLSKLNETGNKCFVQPVSVLKGTGVQEAMKKLALMISESKAKF
jgi:GTPase SAR1 family protein